MKQVFGRMMALFVTSAVLTAPMVVATAGPAFGDTSFGCRVSPGPVQGWGQYCSNNDSPDPSVYNVGFQVSGLSGSEHSFQWTPALYGWYFEPGEGPGGDCNHSSSICTVKIKRAVGSEKQLRMFVDFMQGEVSRSEWAVVYIWPLCKGQPC